MPQITIAGKVVTVEPLQATRRNQELITSVSKDAKDFLEASGHDSQDRRLANVVVKFPEILNMMDSQGRLNPDFVNKHLALDKAQYERDRESIPDMPEYDENAGLQRATEAAMNSLQQYIRQNPNIAKDVYFGSVLWPQSIAGLNKGLDILCKTADVSKLPDDVKTAIAEGPESKLFDDATAAEVAEYVERFLQHSQ